jgi:hypothetical protein
MTSEPRIFRLPGADVHARGILLAGAMAECGVQRVQLVNGADSRECAARNTDLPGALAEIGECEVIADGERLRARSTRECLECSTADSAMIAALERAIRAS